MSAEEVLFSFGSYVLFYFLLPVVSAFLLQLLCSKANQSRIKVTRTAVQPSEPLTQTTSADVEKPIDQDLDAAKNTKHKNVNSSLVQSIDQTPNKVSDEELTNLCTPKWMESGPKRVCKNGRLAQERSKKATKN